MIVMSTWKGSVGFVVSTVTVAKVYSNFEPSIKFNMKH